MQATSGQVCILFPKYLTSIMSTLLSTGDVECFICVVRTLKVSINSVACLICVVGTLKVSIGSVECFICVVRTLAMNDN